MLESMVSDSFKLSVPWLKARKGNVTQYGIHFFFHRLSEISISWALGLVGLYSELISRDGGCVVRMA